METNQISKICQYCSNYNKQKCKITGEYVPRKKNCLTELEHFKYKKNIKPVSTKQKKAQQLSDYDLKEQIFGSRVTVPEIRKPRKTKIK